MLQIIIGGGSEKAYVHKNKVFYHLNSKQVIILKYTVIYITMKEFQNAQPCLLSNYFTGKGQVNIDGEHL